MVAVINDDYDDSPPLDGPLPLATLIIRSTILIYRHGNYTIYSLLVPIMYFHLTFILFNLFLF